eukprot:498390-Amphidinium_carterae.1
MNQNNSCKQNKLPQVPNIPTRQSLYSGIRSQERSFVAQANNANQSSLWSRSCLRTSSLITIPL